MKRRNTSLRRADLKSGVFFPTIGIARTPQAHALSVAYSYCGAAIHRVSHDRHLSSFVQRRWHSRRVAGVYVMLGFKTWLSEPVDGVQSRTGAGMREDGVWLAGPFECETPAAANVANGNSRTACIGTDRVRRELLQ